MKLQSWFEGMPGGLLLLVFAAGLALLAFGGAWMCRGAVGISLRLKIKPVVVGLTVVSIATSMPELFISMVGSLGGFHGLAIGNIVGSNISNIGLILGLSALLCPLVVRLRLIRTDVPLLIGITFLFAFLCWNSLSRLDGGILISLCLGYFILLLRRTGGGSPDEAELELDVSQATPSLPRMLFLLAAGTAALAVGADLLVRSSVTTAQRLGVGDALIGLTIVAVGTSLPELATSVTAALKKQADLCAGNIIGSNLFNLVLISGLVSLVAPIEVERSLFQIEFPALLILTVLLWPVFLTGRVVSRKEGGFLLGLYGLFLLLAILARVGFP